MSKEKKKSKQFYSVHMKQLWRPEKSSSGKDDAEQSKWTQKKVKEKPFSSSRTNKNALNFVPVMTESSNEYDNLVAKNDSEQANDIYVNATRTETQRSARANAFESR